MATTRADAVELREAAPSGGSHAVRPAVGMLSRLALVAMVVNSVAGLWIPDVYGDDDALSAMLQAYDLVTLLVVVPLLASASAARRAGSDAAALVRVGVLGAMAYTYAYHLLGTGFTGALLLNALTFVTVLYAFVLAMMDLDVERFSAPGRIPARIAGGCLAVLTMALAGMWVVASVQAAATGKPPPGSVLVEPAALVHLGVVLDLVLLVPLYGLAAALLWRGRPWGVVLAALSVVSGLLHQVGYLVAMPLQLLADVPGAKALDPFEPVIVLLYVVPAVLLFRGLRGD